MNLNKRKDAKTPRRQEDRNCPATRTKPCLPCLLQIFAPSRLLPFAFLLLCAPALPAQSLRFYASPYRVYEGDAVRFVYLDRTNGVPVPGVIPRANILSWQWDFRNSGNVDDSSSVSTNIDSTWYAVYDPTVATGGVDTYTPKLTVNPAAMPSSSNRLLRWRPYRTSVWLALLA